MLLFLDDDDDDDLLNISNKAGVYDRLPGPPESTGRGGEVDDEYLSSVVVVVGGAEGGEPIFFVWQVCVRCVCAPLSFKEKN